MAYVFEGREFARLKDWQDAYPAYARFTDRLKAGVSTLVEMERAIAEAKGKARAAGLAAARAQTPYTFSRKAGKGNRRG